MYNYIITNIYPQHGGFAVGKQVRALLGRVLIVSHFTYFCLKWVANVFLGFADAARPICSPW